MKTNPYDYAFIERGFVATDSGKFVVQGPALTKREYFAAMDLSGMVKTAGFFDSENDQREYFVKTIAKNSALYADAIIEELNKESNEKAIGP